MGGYINATYSGVLAGMDIVEISIEDRPLVAQLVTDLALKELSPAGFFPETYGKYANHYTVNGHSTVVIEGLKGFDSNITNQECNRILDNTRESLKELDKINQAVNDNANNEVEIQDEQIDNPQLENLQIK